MKKGDNPNQQQQQQLDTTNKKSTSNSNNKNACCKSSSSPPSSSSCGNDPTKEELQAEFSADDKDLQNAATKIQATFRGHLQRKLLNSNMKEEDVDIQEITKKVAEELDIDLTDPELHKAATKIQASFRGHKTRKDTEN